MIPIPGKLYEVTAVDLRCRVDPGASVVAYADLNRRILHRGQIFMYIEPSEKWFMWKHKILFEDQVLFAQIDMESKIVCLS